MTPQAGVSPYVLLAEICFTAISQLAAFFLFSYVAFRMHRKQAEVNWSSTLYFFIIHWACNNGAATFHNVYMMASWRANENAYSVPWIFWTAIIDRSANNGAAAAVLGLTVDRCLVLLLGTGYGPRCKRLVCWATVVVTLVSDVAIFWDIVMIPYGHDPDCRAMGCTISRPPTLYFYFRYVLGTLDIVGAVWFSVLLHRYGRGRLLRTSAPNIVDRTHRVIACTVILEIAEIFSSAFTMLFNGLFVKAGPVGRITSAFVALVTALIHWNLVKSQH